MWTTAVVIRADRASLLLGVSSFVGRSVGVLLFDDFVNRPSNRPETRRTLAALRKLLSKLVSKSTVDISLETLTLLVVLNTVEGHVRIQILRRKCSLAVPMLGLVESHRCSHRHSRVS